MHHRVTILFALAFSACASGQESWPTKQWPTATPEAVGLDARVLAEFDVDLASGKYGYIDNLLVIRHGKIAFERSYKHDYDRIYGAEARRNGPLNPHDFSGPYNYFNTWWHPYYRRGELHTLQSVSKTIASVVVGTARARDEFPKLDTPIMKYFNESRIANLDDRKRRITIRHVLTMTTGLEWFEDLPYEDPRNSAGVMEAQLDWVKYTIDRPMAQEPGAIFNYNSGATQLLAQVFRAATGKDIEEYAVQHLFAQLGIEQHFWKRSPSGLADCEGGLYLRPRDMAKILYLFQKNGVWDGKQLVTEAYVKASVEPSVGVPGEDTKYGFKWWLYPYGPDKSRFAWCGSGFGDQLPILIPEYDLIIVVNGWNTLSDKPSLDHQTTIERVLRAVKH